MYVLAALALIFYVSKVPERYFPGEASKSLESGKTRFVLLFSLERFAAREPVPCLSESMVFLNSPFEGSS